MAVVTPAILPRSIAFMSLMWFNIVFSVYCEIIVGQKIIVLLMLLFCVNGAYSSRLSKFLNKMDAEQKQRDAQEWQQDMNFADFVFRLQRRYVDERGEACRDYEFRARSNPYRHGYYTVCDER